MGGFKDKRWKISLMPLQYKKTYTKISLTYGGFFEHLFNGGEWSGKGFMIWGDFHDPI